MAALYSRITRLAALAALLCIAGCGREPVRPASQPAQPPVFIISIDTLRSDHLAVYGYGSGSTPAIDRFRKDAVLFQRAFSNVPLTLPSHCSMMTGLLPSSHGVRDNLGYTLPAASKTLAELLKQSGYETGGAVSSFVLRKESGMARGFDTYDDLMTVSTLESLTSWQRDGDVSRQVLERWLSTTHSDRVFGFLHLYEPHKPYSPPQPFASRLQNPYDGEVACADSILGTFLNTLRARGLYDRALVIVLSDHGEGLGDHGEAEHGVFLYREAIQIPLLIKLPFNARAGQVETRVASITDIVPTVLGALKAPIPAGLDGLDLFDGAAHSADRMVYSETFYPRIHYGWHELQSLAGARLHFIEAPRVELYDMDADPGETRNVADLERRIISIDRASVQSISAAHPFQAARVDDPEVVARLTSLGYLGSSAAPPAGELPDPKDQLDLLKARGEGAGYLETGEYEKAIATGKRIVQAHPDFLPGWGLISAGYEKLGKRTLALQALQEQMKRSPGNAQVALSMATLSLEEKRLDDARKYAEIARAAAPAFASDLLAQIALSEGNVAEAERQADASLARDDRRVQSLMVLSQVRHRQNDFAQELSLLDRAAATVVQYHLAPIRELQARRGQALLQMQRIGEAEAAFRQETRVFGDDLEAWANLALVVGAQGREGEARTILEEALTRNPGPAMKGLAAEALKVMGER